MGECFMGAEGWRQLVGRKTKDEGRKTKDKGRKTKDERRRTKEGRPAIPWRSIPGEVFDIFGEGLVGGAGLLLQTGMDLRLEADGVLSSAGGLPSSSGPCAPVADPRVRVVDEGVNGIRALVKEAVKFLQGDRLAPVEACDMSLLDSDSAAIGQFPFAVTGGLR